jgi:Prokaryotic Cytochrome C oxidase subunit IV
MWIIRQRITVLIVLLWAATGISWAFGHGGSSLPPRWANLAVLAVAAVKARYVMLDFMEVRTAPGILRALCEFWLISVSAVLAVLVCL